MVKTRQKAKKDGKENDLENLRITSALIEDTRVIAPPSIGTSVPLKGLNLSENAENKREEVEE